MPVKYTVVDDKTNPAEAINGASKLIDDLKVDFVTGLGASNTLIPVFKSFVDASIFVVGALAGPLQFAGKECVPNGFFVSFTNDDWPAAAGKYMTDKGVKRAFFIAADYQAGKEHIGAAMRYFKGQAIGPGLHAADAARLRSRNRAHSRRKTGRGVFVPGRRRRHRLRQTIRAGRAEGPDSRSSPRTRWQTR